MPTAHADVLTDRASRYLVQLCKHLSNKGTHLVRKPRMHGHSGAQPLTDAEAALIRVEWTETDGDVDFGFGRCTLRTTPTALVLRAQAEDDARLQRVMDVLTAHLARYSRREPLNVQWQGLPSPDSGEDTVQGAGGGGDRAGSAGASDRGGRRRVMALVALVVIAAAAHLGVFGWLVASSRWTVGAAGAVAAIVVVKAGAVAVVARRRARAARTGAR